MRRSIDNKTERRTAQKSGTNRETEKKKKTKIEIKTKSHQYEAKHLSIVVVYSFSFILLRNFRTKHKQTKDIFSVHMHLLWVCISLAPTHSTQLTYSTVIIWILPSCVFLILNGTMHICIFILISLFLFTIFPSKYYYVVFWFLCRPVKPFRIGLSFCIFRFFFSHRFQDVTPDNWCVEIRKR